jgi:uncharacterized protein
MVTTIDEKIILCDNSFFGFELKYTDAPKITKSMMIALNDLQLEHLIVVYPGKIDFPLSENIFVCGLDSIARGTIADRFF